MSTARRLRSTLVPAVVSGLAIAVFAGCGSSETSSTSKPTPATNAGTTAAAGAPASTGASGLSTGANATSPPASPKTPTSPSKTATAPAVQPTHRPTASNSSGGGAQAKPGAAPAAVPAKKRYAAEVEDRFLGTCKTGKGSLAGCECVLHRQELRDVEPGHSIAELFILELAIKNAGVTMQAALNNAHPTVRLPAGLMLSLAACKNVHA